jgi:hypothetical protein
MTRTLRSRYLQYIKCSLFSDAASTSNYTNIALNIMITNAAYIVVKALYYKPEGRGFEIR